MSERAALLVAIIVIAFAAVIASAGVKRDRPAISAVATLDEATRQVDRHLRRARTAGTLLMAVAAIAVGAGMSVLGGTARGRPLFVALPIAALLLLVAVAVGEATAPIRRTATVRMATLSPRDTAAYVPTWRIRAMRLTIVGAAAAMAAGIISATDGRALAYTCHDPGTSFVGGEASPYPGSVYAVPGLVVLVVILASAEVTIRRIVRRPPPSQVGTGQDTAVDAHLRRAALRTVCRSATAGAAIFLTQTGLAIGVQAHNATQTLTRHGCRDGSITAADALGGYLTAALGLAILGAIAADVGTARNRDRSGAARERRTDRA